MKARYRETAVALSTQQRRHTRDRGLSAIHVKTTVRSCSVLPGEGQNVGLLGRMQPDFRPMPGRVAFKPNPLPAADRDPLRRNAPAT